MIISQHCLVCDSICGIESMCPMCQLEQVKQKLAESQAVSVYIVIFMHNVYTALECCGTTTVDCPACSAYMCHLFTPCYSISCFKYQYYGRYRFFQFDFTPFRFADKFFLRKLLIDNVLLIQYHSHIIAVEDNPHTWILNH